MCAFRGGLHLIRCTIRSIDGRRLTRTNKRRFIDDPIRSREPHAARSLRATFAFSAAELTRGVTRGPPSIGPEEHGPSGRRQATKDAPAEVMAPRECKLPSNARIDRSVSEMTRCLFALRPERENLSAALRGLSARHSIIYFVFGTVFIAFRLIHFRERVFL